MKILSPAATPNGQGRRKPLEEGHAFNLARNSPKALLLFLSLFAAAGCETLDEFLHSDFSASAPAPSTTVTVAEAPAAAQEALRLDWRFGGFKGGGAVEDGATQIASLKFSASGLSYKWAKGSLKNWGLADTAAGAIAAAFYWDSASASWIGGKFDWISTSRTTRDWANIRSRYNGWDPDAFFAAPRVAFCIVSADGKKRTNLIEGTPK